MANILQLNKVIEIIKSRVTRLFEFSIIMENKKVLEEMIKTQCSYIEAMLIELLIHNKKVIHDDKQNED